MKILQTYFHFKSCFSKWVLEPLRALNYFGYFGLVATADVATKLISTQVISFCRVVRLLAYHNNSTHWRRASIFFYDDYVKIFNVSRVVRKTQGKSDSFSRYSNVIWRRSANLAYGLPSFGFWWLLYSSPSHNRRFLRVLTYFSCVWSKHKYLSLFQ